MDEKGRSNAGQGFGVAGFVIGLIALIISFIPCLGMYALVPGIIALVFCLIAFSQASSANAPRGLIIAALIISVVGTSIAAWQLHTIRRATTGLDKFGPEPDETFRDDIGNEIRENIRRALDGLEDYEHIDSLEDDTIEFDSKEMIEQLEKLEGEKNNN
ncbi:MAG: hypothetical protein R6U58_07635 [Bacteroidales bacterium]